MSDKLTPKEVIKLRKNLANPSEFRTMLAQLGFKKIGEGLYRVVYRKEEHNFVVKIAKGSWEHSRREFEYSKQFGKNRFIARPLEYHEDVFIQQFVVGELCESYNCCPPKNMSIGDWHRQNHVHVGKHRRPVVFDLGYDNPRS